MNENYKKFKYKQLKKDLSCAISELLQTQEKLNSANRAIKSQSDHIAMLNRQLDQQDKAIEYKDTQFLGLRSAYRDDLINGFK